MQIDKNGSINTHTNDITQTTTIIVVLLILLLQYESFSYHTLATMATQPYTKNLRKPLGDLTINANSSSLSGIDKAGKSYALQKTLRQKGSSESIQGSSSSSFCEKDIVTSSLVESLEAVEEENSENMLVYTHSHHSQQASRPVRTRCTNPMFKSISYSLQGDTSFCRNEFASIDKDVQLFRSICEEGERRSTSNYVDDDEVDDEIVSIVASYNNGMTNIIEPIAVRVNENKSQIKRPLAGFRENESNRHIMSSSFSAFSSV